MRIKRFLAAAICLTVVTLSFSCEKQSTSEVDDIYALDKKKVTNENT